MKMKSLMLFLLIAFAMLFIQSCKSTGMEKSILEESKNETIAAYAACIRQNTNPNNTAGFNIRDCDVLKTEYLKYNELRICEQRAPEKKNIIAISLYTTGSTVKNLYGKRKILKNPKRGIL